MLLLFLAGLSILMKNIAYLIIQFKKDKKSLNLLLEKYPEFKETK